MCIVYIYIKNQIEFLKLHFLNTAIDVVNGIKKTFYS